MVKLLIIPQQQHHHNWGMAMVNGIALVDWRYRLAVTFICSTPLPELLLNVGMLKLFNVSKVYCKLNWFRYIFMCLYMSLGFPCSVFPTFSTPALLCRICWENIAIFVLKGDIKLQLTIVPYFPVSHIHRPHRSHITVLLAFVWFIQYQAKRLAGKNVSKISYSVSSGT